MSVQLTNTTFELRITPNKRKRDDLKERKHQQYNYGNNKENHFVFNNFMEVKSIAELIESKNLPHSNAINNCNAFEVVRKPPKKKNRKDISDDGCFVNPALNLDGPEKVVNPFEVKRAAPLPEAVHHCFENTGLNIRGEDRHITNPFEVAREAKAIAVDNSSGKHKIINRDLNSLKIQCVFTTKEVNEQKKHFFRNRCLFGLRYIYYFY